MVARRKSVASRSDDSAVPGNVRVVMVYTRCDVRCGVPVAVSEPDFCQQRPSLKNGRLEPKQLSLSVPDRFAPVLVALAMPHFK